ncbi:MAG: MFS transporter [Firmicutes bacterium]|nr:MFS transporter [Bacillota bacterium]
MKPNTSSDTIWSKNLVIITLSNFMLFLGFEMLVVTLPVYIAECGGSDAAVGLSVGVFTFSALLMRAVAGWMLDRFGRRVVFSAGLIIMLLIALLYGAVVSVALIIAVRILHSVGWGMSSTASNTIAADSLPPARFAEGMGYFALSNSLGMAAGPALGLLILARTGFHGMFAFAAATAGVALLLSFFMTMRSARDLQSSGQESPAASGSQASQPESGRTVQADGSRPDQTGSRSGSRSGLFRFLLHPGAVFPALTILLISTSYGALTGFVALYGAERNIGNSGIYFAVYAISMLLTRPIAGRLTDRKGTAFVVWPGMLLTFLGMLCLGSAKGLPLFLVSAALYGTGMGICMSSLEALAVASVPAERRGSATATFMIGFDGGIGIGSVIAGLLASAAGYDAMYRIISIFIVLSAVWFFAGLRRRQSH